MVGGWADEGTIDLLDWFAELTIYTSSACLIGRKFRHELDRRFAELYHDLEQGTDAIAYVDPYAPIDSFRRRDEARLGLVALVQGIMDRRSAGPARHRRGPRPARRADVDPRRGRHAALLAPTWSPGMFISMMFAGHHTTSGTAAWTLIELLRHPDELAAVRAELDELYAHGEEVSYQALRDMPRLESAIKEALRLHPPLILVLRVVKEELEVEGYRDRAGQAGGGEPGGVEPHRRGLPRPRRLRPRALPRAPGRGPRQPVDVDPLRRRPAPLRGRALRHDAAEGHLLGAAAALGLRAGPAVGHLPQRPLQDGRAAGPAVRGRLPPARRCRWRGVATTAREGRSSTATCARVTGCASPRPRRCSRCRRTGVLEVLDESPPEELRAQVEAAVKFCPTHALRIEE